MQLECDNKMNQVFFFSTLRKLSVNRKYLQALTLVGLPRGNPQPDPLAVLHLDNQLYIIKFKNGNTFCWEQY